MEQTPVVQGLVAVTHKNQESQNPNRLQLGKLAGIVPAILEAGHAHGEVLCQLSIGIIPPLFSFTGDSFRFYVRIYSYRF